MRKATTIIIVVMMIAVAVVMCLYWQRETSMIMKGVLVGSGCQTGRIV